MQTPYTVPEIARLTGIPETTLYDYVKQFSGIVPEMDAADEGSRQRRRYPEQAIAVFQTIRHLKDRGVDLPTIRALLQEGKTQEDESREPISLEFLPVSENGARPEMDFAPATEALSQETIESTVSETKPEDDPIGEVSVLTDALIAAPVYGEASLAVDMTVAIAEPAEVVERELPETSATSQSPFFEAPVAIETAAVESTTSTEPDTAWTESAPAVEATLLESAPIALTSETVEEPRQTALSEIEAPEVVEPDLLVLRGQLFTSLDEGLRCLRELMDGQQDDNQEMQDELAREKEENERLRAALAYQQEQARSAERLLGFIKAHCEQGIQAITT
jgi:DNA-binding transcriptional MerR regulator